MSTFCISDISCVEVLTCRVSQETQGKKNLFTFECLIGVVIIPWKYKKSVFFLHIQTRTPYCGHVFQEISDLR